SDAQTTAGLLIKLQNKIADFPVTLLEKLTQMGRQLEFETGDCFKAVYDKKRKLDSKLPAKLRSVGGIILPRPDCSKDSLAPLDYATSLAEKEKLFTNSIEVRSAQVSMMDEIAVFFNSDEQVRTIDAPTGMGKTLGYLFPAAYQVGQGKQIVLSTAT